MSMSEFIPELWFNVIVVFNTADITVGAMKFGYVLTALGSSYTIEVRDIVMKTELIKRLSLSPH